MFEFWKLTYLTRTKHVTGRRTPLLLRDLVLSQNIVICYVRSLNRILARCMTWKDSVDVRIGASKWVVVFHAWQPNTARACRRSIEGCNMSRATQRYQLAIKFIQHCKLIFCTHKTNRLVGVIQFTTSRMIWKLTIQNMAFHDRENKSFSEPFINGVTDYQGMFCRAVLRALQCTLHIQYSPILRGNGASLSLWWSPLYDTNRTCVVIGEVSELESVTHLSHCVCDANKVFGVSGQEVCFRLLCMVVFIAMVMLLYLHSSKQFSQSLCWSLVIMVLFVL